ncbi:MAG TPA: NADH-quinone oxidoreductase subunit C [Flexilinea sp.]|jgi:Ni,Fe-hydrogenase III component G|nr:NADH-quinone oxidoreductase subunit C [Flexilinea sp.]HOP01522.1 NADH-quinone oxidoreductase subunit C [Flexilinea sp.]HPJ64052.1 NADH-quinone oxidoreductase subunit C [Flexilinea sp.]HPR70913.1 NADH-quinone oxidoreductase subunit C [Flexilinea sp.]
MEKEELLNQFQKIFTDLAIKTEIPAIQPNRVDVYINSNDLLKAVQKLVEHDWGYLITISAYDTADENGSPQIGLVYQFGEQNVIGTLRFFLPYSNLTVESICPIIPSATLYERECMELFGIDIRNTPDRSKLILPENWPDGVFPLRKSFSGLQDNPETKSGEE